MSVIAMDSEGKIGAATNLELFPFVVGNTAGVCRVLAVEQTEDGMQIFEPDGERWKRYEGD